MGPPYSWRIARPGAGGPRAKLGAQNPGAENVQKKMKRGRKTKKSRENGHGAGSQRVPKQQRGVLEQREASQKFFCRAGTGARGAAAPGCCRPLLPPGSTAGPGGGHGAVTAPKLTKFIEGLWF